MINPLALIIEDDPHLADIFSMALQVAEFETEIVRDGDTALTRLRTTTPAVVLLDLHLPFVSGKEILQLIRRDVRLAQTRVMLTTANVLEAEGLRDTADLVLLKPIGFTQLSELAARLRPPDPSGSS